MSNAPPKKVSFKRRLKRFLTRPFLQVVYLVVPRLYYVYMMLVWYTSKVETYGMEKLLIVARDRHRGCLASLWHENVFFVAYFFQKIGPTTVASISQLGELITRMLQVCGFNVFRGGSSKGKSRKKEVLLSMIRYMKAHYDVIYGITVDGSSGPPYVVKNGVLALSYETGMPIYCLHILSTPTFRLPTWDRTRVALPFSRIIVFAEGPYFCTSTESNELKQSQIFLNEAMMDNMKRAEHYLKTGEFLPPSDSVKPPTEYQESQLRPGKWLMTDEPYRPTTLKNEVPEPPSETSEEEPETEAELS